MMNFRKILVSALFLIFPFFAFAEFVTSDLFGYSVDIPEGFEILDMSEDQKLVQFSQKNFPATILLCVYSNSEFSSAQTALLGAFKKLGATGEIKTVRWRRLACAASKFSMEDKNGIFGGQSQRGWAAAFPLVQKKSILVALSFVPQSFWKEGECVAKSTVDSVMLDVGSFKEPGILTSLEYPQKIRLPVNLKIADIDIETQVFAEDSAASQAVIDREFNVFLIYAKNSLPETTFAWQRFYRMIMRDSLGRLKKASFDISSALQNLALEKDEKNPKAAIAAILLEWVQNFKYSRASTNMNKADFANIVSVLKNEGSDCDSRSLLVAVLLKNMGINSCFFVSAKHSHAILGVSLPDKQGFSFDVDGVPFLVGDTVAKGATLGKIDPKQIDRSTWVEVEFPF